MVKRLKFVEMVWELIRERSKVGSRIHLSLQTTDKHDLFLVVDLDIWGYRRACGYPLKSCHEREYVESIIDKAIQTAERTKEVYDKIHLIPINELVKLLWKYDKENKDDD